MKPIIVIMDGGLVQEVLYDGFRLPTPLVIIDYDTEGADGFDRLVAVPQNHGTTSDAIVSVYDVSYARPMKRLADFVNAQLPTNPSPKGTTHETPDHPI